MERLNDRLDQIEDEINDIDRALIDAESKHHHATRWMHDRKHALVTERIRIKMGTLPLSGAVEHAAIKPEPVSAFPSLCDSGGELWDADEAS